MKISVYKTFTAAVMAILFITADSIAEEKAGSSEKITYQQFIDNVKEQLPELKKNRIQVEKAKNTLYGAGSSRDIYLSGETGYGKGDVLSMGTSAEKRNYSSKIALTKRVAQTGTEISTGAAYSRTEYDTEGTPAYSSPSVYVKFSQSLLKNTFGTIDRYAVNNAKMLYEIEKLRETESNKSDINYYRKIYFAWIGYREELKMIDSSINTSIKLAESIKNRYRSGMVNSADLYSSAAVVLKYQIAYEELKTEMNVLETELNLFLNSSDEKNITPDDREFFSFYDTSLKSEYSPVSFENTSNAEIFRLTKNNLKYSADVSENRLLPELNIVGEYTKKSEGSSFSNSAGKMNSSDYYIGFAFSHSLQNTENISSLEESKLAIAGINSEYMISRNSYIKSLESIKSRYANSRRMINLRERRIETLENKYRFEQQKYQQAQLDIETLINTSIEITNEKISLIRLKKQMIENFLDYSDLTE